jgi:hypothetical protein
MKTKKNGKSIGHLVDVGTKEVMRILTLNLREEIYVLFVGIMLRILIDGQNKIESKGKLFTIQEFGAL